MAAHEISEGPPDVASQNWRHCRTLMWTWITLIAVSLVYRIYIYITQYIRTVACVGNSKQPYFRYPNAKLAALRRHLLDAPLFGKRHRDPLMVTDTITIGSPPSRLQSIVVLLYLVINIVLLSIDIPWKTASLGEACHLMVLRSGALATMNMLPLFLLAGRNNPLISLLDINFNTYNLIHRWLGRIVVGEVLVHAITWTYSAVNNPEKGWSGIKYAIANVPLITTGFIATVCMIVLILQSFAILRAASYEVFLHTHILLAVVVVATLYLHLRELRYQRLVIGLIVIWAVERLARVYLIVRSSVGKGGTRAEVVAMQGDAMRVTLHMARPWTFKPGQFVYLYMPSVGLWTSHPFSLSWSEQTSEQEMAVMSEKGLVYDKGHSTSSYDELLLPEPKSSMSLIIRRRTGFTDKLWQKCQQTGRYSTTAYVEGPYGGHNLDSFGTVMLFAAGVGITHQIPYVRHLVAGYANGTTATRRVTLVWILQSPEHLDWVRECMDKILVMEGRRDVLKILLFITRPRSAEEIRSPSQTVQLFPGKPSVDLLIGREQMAQQGAMAVSVCGTGSLSDDVRRSVRRRAAHTSIEMVDHLFSW